MTDTSKHQQANSQNKGGSKFLYGALGLLGAGLLYRAASRRSTGFSLGKSKIVQLQGSVNIDRPAEEIYSFWRDFTQLPKAMTFLDRIEDKGDNEKLTHWVVKTPLGASIDWDSMVTDDVPNERIAWESVEGSDIHTWGEVRFRNTAQRGTNVILNLNFEPPGKAAGATIEQFLGGLEKAVLNQNLRNLKAYLETGEVATNRRQPPRSQQAQTQHKGLQ